MGLDLDELEAVVLQHAAHAVARQPAVVVGRIVLAEDERDGDDDVTAGAHDADELADGVVQVRDVLEHLRAEHGVELAVVDRPAFAGDDQPVDVVSREDVEPDVPARARNPVAVGLGTATDVEHVAAQRRQQRAQHRVEGRAGQPLVMPRTQARVTAGVAHVAAVKQARAVVAGSVR